MEKSLASAATSRYENLKSRIEKQLEAFKVVVSFSPQLSPNILIHNLEQVLENDTAGIIKTENEDDHMAAASPFNLNESSSETETAQTQTQTQPATQSEAAVNDHKKDKILYKSWELICLTVLDDLLAQNVDQFKLKLDRIKTQLSNGQYETPMDFHMDLRLTFNPAEGESVPPKSEAADLLWSLYARSDDMIKLFTAYETKLRDALTTFKLAAPKSNVTVGTAGVVVTNPEVKCTASLSKLREAVLSNLKFPTVTPPSNFKVVVAPSEDPFDETRLKEADKYLSANKQDRRTKYDCLMCKMPLYGSLFDARRHVLRVHFFDRYQCSGCFKKFYKPHSLKRHKVICLKNNQNFKNPLLDVKKSKLPPKNVSYQSNNEQMSKKEARPLLSIRNAFPNFSLTRALNATVQLERLSGNDEIPPTFKVGSDILDANSESMVVMTDQTEIDENGDKMEAAAVTQNSEILPSTKSDMALPDFSQNESDLNSLKRLEQTEKVSQEKVLSLIQLLDGTKNKYRCTVCSTTMVEQYRAVRHVRGVHLLERNHMCGKCGKRFFSKSNLNRHQRSCRNEPRKLDEKDASRDKVSSLIQVLQNINDDGGDAPKCRYKCTTCSLIFMQSWSAHEHVRCVHLKERRYFCGSCDKGFWHRSRLRLHEKSCGGGSGNGRKLFLAAKKGHMFSSPAKSKSTANEKINMSAVGPASKLMMEFMAAALGSDKASQV